jgi:fumarate reductase flavoprotein subunit
MDTSSHDVLLVGGGGAGLRAAIAAAEVNPNLSIAVVSKVYPMRSHTVSAEGGAAGVAKPDDSLDEHAHDTISGGDWLCDQDAVEAFVKEASLELLLLERWGCPWNREPDGHIAVRAFGGMKKRRTWFAADKTGFHMLHTLFQTSMKFDPITRYDEWFVTKLLVDDGRVQGVVAIELMSGRIQAITAKAVILCTGGCGRIFPFTTNANIKNGDGMALAYRAGAPLKDMEFVQYHPTGLPFTGILITEAARAEGGYMLNKDGYRYLQDYNLGTPEAKPVLRTMELGAHHQHRVWFGSSPRPAPPRREANQRQAALRPRALLEVPERRPRQRVDSRSSGGALHDGRRQHGHQRRDPHFRTICCGRGCLRQHQWRKSARIQLIA